MNTKMKVRIKKICAEAVIPQYAHSTDAGLDLVAVSKSYDDYGNIVYGTGLAIEIPEGYVGLIFPRSSISKKHLMLTNSVGVIDSGYRGEVMCKYKPFSNTLDETGHFDCFYNAHDIEDYNIGDRMAQLIIIPYPHIEFEEVAELSDTDRGTGGYGSTENLLAKQTNIERNILNGIKYMLGELVDNIAEHSQSEYGYIFAQAYPSLGYIDICLADTGVTLWGSYKSICDTEIESDMEAMRAATKGVSTKNLPEAENRGYGIITSVAMSVKGLKGSFMMVSGKACYGITSKGSAYVEVPDNIHFKGTIIALRIPCKTNPEFNYLQYVAL